MYGAVENDKCIKTIKLPSVNDRLNAVKKI